MPDSPASAGNSQIGHVQVPFEPDYRQVGALVGADRLRGIQTNIQQQQADWVSCPCALSSSTIPAPTLSTCLSCTVLYTAGPPGAGSPLAW